MSFTGERIRETRTQRGKILRGAKCARVLVAYGDWTSGNMTVKCDQRFNPVRVTLSHLQQPSQFPVDRYDGKILSQLCVMSANSPDRLLSFDHPQ